MSLSEISKEVNHSNRNERRSLGWNWATKDLSCKWLNHWGLPTTLLLLTISGPLHASGFPLLYLFLLFFFCLFCSQCMQILTNILKFFPPKIIFTDCYALWKKSETPPDAYWSKSFEAPFGAAKRMFWGTTTHCIVIRTTVNTMLRFICWHVQLKENLYIAFTNLYNLLLASIARQVWSLKHSASCLVAQQQNAEWWRTIWTAVLWLF